MGEADRIAEQELYKRLTSQINQEKDLLELMKGQISADLYGTFAVLGSKLEGLKSKSQYLSRFLQFSFKLPQASLSPAENFNTFASISLENSDTLDLDPSTAKVTFHPDLYFDEIDSEIQKLNSRLSSKDAKIFKLKQVISTCLQEKEEIITQQEEEINILKHQTEIYKHHIKHMRGQINRLGGEITQYERNYDGTIRDFEYLQEKNRNLEAEILTLMKNLNESEETIKEYEKILESAGISTSFSESCESFSKVYQLKITISRLNDELRRKDDENLKEISALEAKFNTVLGLYEKTLTDKQKATENIRNLEEQVADFKQTIVENEKNSLEKMVKLQEGFMARIASLQLEKYELKKKLKDLKSTEFEGNGRVSLRDEIKEIGNEKENIFSFVNNTEMEEFEVKELQQKVEENEEIITALGKKIYELRNEIEGKNEEILTLESKLRSSLTAPRGRNSIFSKVKPNPLVLKLFHN